jgi:hypothetical protein
MCGPLLASLVDQDKMNYMGAQKWSFYLSSGLFLAAVSMYLLTMYAYDRLLMPKRFWAEDLPPEDLGRRPKWIVWRPPSSDSWILYQNMMRIWYCLFTPATYAVVIALLFLAYGVFSLNFSQLGVFTCLFWVGAVAAAVGFRLYYKQFGPKIGSRD